MCVASPAKNHDTFQLAPELHQLLKQIRNNALGFFFVSFIVPIVAHESLNASGLQMSLLFSLQTIGALASSVVSGRLADTRRHRGSLVFLGSLGRGLAYFCIFAGILTKSYTTMVTGTFSLGFFAGFFWNPLRAIVADAVPFKHRSQAFGHIDREQGIGSLMGSLLGFFLFWQATSHKLPNFAVYFPFVVFAFANVYAGIRILHLSDKVPVLEHQTESRPRVIEATQTSPFLSSQWLFFGALLCLLFTENLVISLVSPFLQVYFLKHVTTDVTLLSIASIPGSVFALILAPRVGKLADRYDPRWFLSIASLLGAGCTWGLLHVTQLSHIVVISCMTSVATGSASLVLMKIVSSISEKRRGSVFGVQALIQSSGAITGPIVGGILWEKTGDAAPFLLSMQVGITVAVCYFVLFSFAKKFLPSAPENKTESVQDANDALPGTPVAAVVSSELQKQGSAG